MGKDKNRIVRKQVGTEPQGKRQAPVPPRIMVFNNGKTKAAHGLGEIAHSNEPDVGCVVPLVAQHTRNGQLSAHQNTCPNAPVGEVGEGHHGFAADAQHFAQDAFGVAHGLQGAREHDMVEGLVVEACQALFQVALNHVDAVGNGSEHRSVFELDTIALGAPLVDQALQQRAVAAAEVEHALAGLHPAGDQVEVGTLEGGAHSFTRFR